jgi:phage gp36-like protein
MHSGIALSGRHRGRRRDRVSYATLQDMIDRFGETELSWLTTDFKGQEIDEAMLRQGMDCARRIVDGHIGASYDLPLNSVPPKLVDLYCDVARYCLWGSNAPLNVGLAYDDAMEIIVRIGLGEIAPDDLE